MILQGKDNFPHHTQNLRKKNTYTFIIPDHLLISLVTPRYIPPLQTFIWAAEIFN